MQTKITIILENDSIKDVQIEKIKTEERDNKTYSQYARFFDESSEVWQKDPEHNLAYLKSTQDLMNERLRLRGYLFLNEVYERLGLPKTKAGQVVGWVYDKENPVGDNFVDFGLFDEKSKPFINGLENSVLLDFNVDGNVLEVLK